MDNWKIWYKEYDLETGKVIGSGFYVKEYKTFGRAVNTARKRYGDLHRFRWAVNRENPWFTTCDICGKSFEWGNNFHNQPFSNRTTSRFVDYDNRKTHNIYYNNVCPDCAREAIELLKGMKERKNAR